jgi:ankyrin repeat protein
MNTPLHIAIQNGNIEIIKSLLADGCNVHARNNEGLTPLDLATTLNSEEIVHLLLEHGAGHPPQQPAYSTASVLFAPEQRKKVSRFGQ